MIALFRFHLWRLLLAGALTLGLLAPAVAQNLVNNPYFTNAASGWTVFTTTYTTPSRTLLGVPPAALSAGGSTAFYSGCIGAACLTFPATAGPSSGVRQSITTTPGTGYVLSFWVYFGSRTTTNQIDVYWGNTRVFSANNQAVGWSQQIINLGAATGASTTLTALIRDDPAFSEITGITVTAVPNLSLSIGNPPGLVATLPANYSLSVSNSSTVTSPASITVLNQLPPNYQYNSAAPGAGASAAACTASGTLAAGQLLTCTLSTPSGLAAGASARFSINVTPLAGTNGIASTNKASVPITGSGTAAAPSSCTATGTPAGCAVAPTLTPDAVLLRLGKLNPAQMAVGGLYNYTLTLSNEGTAATAASFVLQDQLPANISFVSAAVVSNLGSLSCSAAGQLVTCTVGRAGGIPAGTTASLTLTVTPQAAAAGQSIINKASVPANGVGSGVTPGSCVADDLPQGCAVTPSIMPLAALLSVAKTMTVLCDPVNGSVNPKNIPGAVVRWTITVSNAGSTAVDLNSVSNPIGSGLSHDPHLITGTGGAAACSSASGTPESGSGKGFKLSIGGTPVLPATGLRPAASYPRYFTSAADGDAASLAAGSVTIDYSLALPAEGTAPNNYSAGQLKPGEQVSFSFNTVVN